MRTYASSLQDAGIDQPGFLNFLDVLSRSSSVCFASPSLDLLCFVTTDTCFLRVLHTLTLSTWQHWIQDRQVAWLIPPFNIPNHLR